MAALLGVAVGVVAVLVMFLVVSVVIARRRCSCGSKDESNNSNLEGTPVDSMWECYQADLRLQERHQPTSGTDAEAKMYTTLFNTHTDSTNGRVLNYSSKQNINEISYQVDSSVSP